MFIKNKERRIFMDYENQYASKNVTGIAGTALGLGAGA